MRQKGRGRQNEARLDSFRYCEVGFVCRSCDLGKTSGVDLLVAELDGMFEARGGISSILLKCRYVEWG